VIVDLGRGVILQSALRIANETPACHLVAVTR
jgi:hypothetical protein